MSPPTAEARSGESGHGLLRRPTQRRSTARSHIDPATGNASPETRLRRGRTRTRAGSSPTASEPVPHHRPSGDERGLGRRCRLEHVGGDQPRRRSHEREELRVAHCYGAVCGNGARRSEPEHLRDALCSWSRRHRAFPYFAYNHADKVVTSPTPDTCPTGSSLIAGLAFYPATGGSFPAGVRRSAVLRGLLA